MRRIPLLIILAQALFGQGWNITLHSGEELTHLNIQWVKRDSLVVRADDSFGAIPTAIPLDQIDEIRRVSGHRMGDGLVKGAAVTMVGGTIGAGVGFLFYRFALPWLSNGKDDEDGPELRNVFVYSSALLGLLHGKNWALKRGADTAVYALGRMDSSQKLHTVDQLEALNSPPLFQWVGETGCRLAGLHWYEWEVTLTSGQVYAHAILGRLSSDSLWFDVGSVSYTVPVRLIREVRRYVSWGRYLPPVAGGLLGAYGGGIAGRVMSDRILELPAGSPVKPFPMVAGAILGTAVGARYVPRSGVVYDLSGLTDEEKGTALNEYVLARP